MKGETRHTIVLVLGTGVAAALGMIYSIYAGHILGPESYADFVAAVSFFTMATAALAPLSSAVARFSSLYDTPEERGKIRTLSFEVQKRLNWAALIALVFGLAFLKPLMRALNFDSPWPLIGAYGVTVMAALICVPRNVMRGMHRFGHMCANMIFENAFRLALGALIFLFAANAFAGLSAYLIAFAVASAVAWAQVSRFWAGCRPQPISGVEIRRYTFWVVFLAFGSAGFQNIDVLFVKHLFVAEEAGRFGAAATLAKIVGLLFMPFNILALPLLTARHRQGRGMLRPLARICGSFLALAAGPLLIVWLWPEWVLRLYGEAYVTPEAVATLLPLSAGLMIGGLGVMIGSAFSAANEFKFLWPYLTGLAAEAVCLKFFGSSLRIVANIALAAKAATLIVLIVHFSLWRRWRKRDVADQPANIEYSPSNDDN